MVMESVFDIGAYEYSKQIRHGSIKKLANGESVTIESGCITAIFPALGCSYLEMPDRSSAIRLGTADVPAMGTVVYVEGTLQSDPSTGERYIIVNSVITVPNTSYLMPKVMTFKNWDIGGGPEGLQQGVLAKRFYSDWISATGLNNIGLLVQTYGKISRVDPTGKYFYIDDGSKLRDNTKYGSIYHWGIRVEGDGRSYTSGQFVAVTGLSSYYLTPEGKLTRMIRIRSANDIKKY